MKQNNTNKTFKTELEKLKQMSIEDRLWYIWEYYKLQIFAFFLVIFLLYEAGTCIYRNLQDTMLYCVTVNETSLLSSDFSVVQKEFEEKNGSGICSELKGINTGKVLRSCDGCVADAAEIAEKYLYSK